MVTIREPTPPLFFLSIYILLTRYRYIGKMVGSHTNLTEIKESLDLLWRAGVVPSQVVLGMGFYGRSFTLSDLSCTGPGCPFTSAGAAGPCSNTAGILSYKGVSCPA